MKKPSLNRKLRLDKESVAVLSNHRMREANGARPPILPPSWFECTFTIYCD